MTLEYIELQQPLAEVIITNLQTVANNLKMSQIVQTLSSHIVVRTSPQYGNSTMHYISLFPLGNRAEETIDTIFTLTLQSEAGTIHADMAWSAGQVLTELLVLDIESNQTMQILEQVNSRVKLACQHCEEHYISLLEGIKATHNPSI